MKAKDGTWFKTLDSRGRITLSDVATVNAYKVTVEPSGRITLDPAVVVTLEQWEGREFMRGDIEWMR